MRCSLVLGLLALAVTDAVGAEKPIPQDTARMEKRRSERLEWNLRTTLGAYDEIGKKDPRWDKQARQAMDLAARMFSLQVDPFVSFDEVYKAAKAAVDAGCDDPLLVYIRNRNSFGPNYPGDEEAIRRSEAAAKALSAGGYPPFRCAVAFRAAGNTALYAHPPSEDYRKQAGRDFDAALALLPKSVAGDERNGFWEDTWFEIFFDLIRGYRRLGTDVLAAYEKIDAKLEKAPELKALQLRVRGAFWYNHAWEARTTAFAPQVPAGGFELFEKRVGVARKAFQEAWRTRPGDARTADSQLEIEKSVGGDRDTMELWFDRAMKADGDDREACWIKLDWLDPKWHGTTEEMLDFGRACRATKNWRAGITLLVGDAHHRYYNRLPPQDRSAYMSSPEVWEDIKSVYDEYLEHIPSDAIARSKYASLCYLAAHYPEAHAQFQSVGDNLTSWTEFPYFPLESLKGMRDDTARIVAGK